MEESETPQALTKRSADSMLMPPPPPKRIRRPATVLEEDAYTDALSHIIKRDFFPGLLELQTQQEFLDALDSRDTEWIQVAGRRLKQAMTPGSTLRRSRGQRGASMTPSATPKGGRTPLGWAGETPMSTTSSATATASESLKPTVEMEMSLTNFQARYTSEDNESFNAVLDKQNNMRAKKYAWLWAGNKIPSGRQIAHRAREEEQKKMLKAKSLETDSDDSDAVVLRRPSADDRPAMPDVRLGAPKNPLMFIPDSIEETLETIMQAAEAESVAGPKIVVYSNTRLPSTTDPFQAAGQIPPSPSISAVNDAIAGRPRRIESEAGSSGAETPRVNGYAFVDAEPEPGEADAVSRMRARRDDAGSDVGDDEDDDASLIAQLAASTDPQPSLFQIKEASKRETLHHALVARSAASKRVATPVATAYVSRLDDLMESQPGRTPTPKYASALDIKSGSLTPAARRLLSKVQTPGRGEAGSVFGGAGRTPARDAKAKVRWTPTPKMKQEIGT